MKLPQPPPDLSSLLATIDPTDITKILASEPGPLVNEAYLHWEELRHRTPPGGLDHERWWLGLRLARQALLKPLPLLDKKGRPFLFGSPDPVQIDLHHIDQDAAGEIKSATETTPAARDRYLLRSVIEEAITSSQLEGASTTRKVAADMLRSGRSPRDRSEQMIFNNYLAMQAIQGFKNEPLTPARVLDIHRRVSEHTLDDPRDVGRLRQSNDIHVVDNDDGTILHQPPDHHELPERLERVCAFANAGEDQRPFVHPVLRAILLHFMIGYDHPFADGNGRTARALFYWSMLRSGYWLAEFISISHILRKAPAQYGRAYLFTETDGGDTTYFLIHQLATMRKAVQNLHDYLTRKAKEQRGMERLLAESPALHARLNHRQKALLTHALKHPGAGYRVETHQRTHGVVNQTARTDLLQLAELGLLEKVKEGRAFLFLAPEDLAARMARLES
ncbi:Fic family protein [Geothrix fermentans]|uniref:Fic family protein n=1 Tax=Geothrix fermentans TaxID=44676 RepID=UPI00040E79FD|nr:Fic family protein [Geothrix fermentans]